MAILRPEAVEILAAPELLIEKFQAYTDAPEAQPLKVGDNGIQTMVCPRFPECCEQHATSYALRTDELDLIAPRFDFHNYEFVHGAIAQ